MQSYFIYDGRARNDIDSAFCIECFQSKNDNQAAKYHAKNYKNQDTVLCDKDDNIIY